MLTFCSLLFMVHYLPRMVSTAAVLIALSPLLLYWAINISKDLCKSSAAWLVALAYLASVSFATRSHAINEFIWLTETKILAIPLIAIAITKLHTPNRPTEYYVRGLSWFFIITNTFLFAASSFAFRYTDQFPISTLSIYMSIALAPLVLAEHSRLRSAILIIFIALLGSSTGLAALSAGFLWIHKRRLIKISSLKTWLLLIFAVCGLFVIYQYNLEQRGRDLLDLASLDRYQLVSAAVQLMASESSLWNLLFGFGTGAPLPNAESYFAPDATVLPWLLAGFGVEGFSGRLWHNEFFRVYFNFGIIGLILVCSALFFQMGRSAPLLAALAAASFFNSTVYIFPVIVSYLIYAKVGILSLAIVERPKEPYKKIIRSFYRNPDIARLRDP